MRPAVFLDRDGTVNVEVDVLRDVAQLEVIPKADEAIKRLNDLGFLVIIITNQPVVARGWLTEEGLGEVHKVLLDRLATGGAKVDAVYYCPHHPDANLPEYRVVCECRKPGIKLIEDATKKFGIDLARSYMVGDHTRDILTGQKAGLRTVLVRTGYAGKDGYFEVVPDHTADDLRSAVDWIEHHAK